MLLDFITIVLRETLEASFLISLLLVFSYRLRLGPGWLAVGFVLGGLGALLYAWALPVLSQWFDYVGQEVVNAAMQYLIYLSLLMLVALVDTRLGVKSLLLSLMLFTVTVAIIREGAEIFLFYSGYIHSGGRQIQAVVSGSIGLLLGLSACVLVYYLVSLAPPLIARSLQFCLLMLVGSGMVIQATQLLLQADWLPASDILWDSNWLLPEASTIGQLTYAVFGYEATPSRLESGFYAVAVVLFFFVPALVKKVLGDKGQTDVSAGEIK